MIVRETFTQGRSVHVQDTEISAYRELGYVVSRSPYHLNPGTRRMIAMIRELQETGKTEHGWSDFEIIGSES